MLAVIVSIFLKKKKKIEFLSEIETGVGYYIIYIYTAFFTSLTLSFDLLKIISSSSSFLVLEVPEAEDCDIRYRVKKSLCIIIQYIV